MEKSSAPAAENSDISDGADSRVRAPRARRSWRSWRAWPGRVPYGWVAAPVAAALVVVRASAVPLDTVGVPARAAAVAGLLAGSTVLAVTPGVALVSVVARCRRLGPATALGLLYAGAGTAAVAGFWAWYRRPAFGVHVDLALLAASVAAIAVFGRRGDLGRLGLAPPLALALAVSALYTGIIFLQGPFTIFPWDRVGHLIWMEPDSYLPMMFATRVAAHAPLGGYLTGEWLTSDRPPLQTGFVLLQWPLWAAAGRQGGYQFLGTVLQSAWVPALWVLFRVRGITAGRTCAAVLATAATGVMFFNTVYVWPKMLAGALALPVLAILVSRDPADRWRGAPALAAALAALSLLAHGGTVFGLIALVPFLYPLRREITVRAVAAFAAIAAVLYVPWMLYQHFVVPPGNRLIKWMLAGVVLIDKRGALQTIVQQYRSLSPGQLLVNKWDSVRALVGSAATWGGARGTWPGSFLGDARVAEITNIVPAAGPLLLGAVALLLPPARRRLADARPLAAFTALALAVTVLLLWGGTNASATILLGPYAAVTAFAGLCALAVTALPRWLSGALLTANFAWFALEWLPGLSFRPTDPTKPPSSPVDWSMAVLCGCALAAIMAVTAVACRKPGQTGQQDQPAEPDQPARLPEPSGAPAVP